MPPRRGYIDSHIVIPDALAQQIANAVSYSGKTRAQWYEDTLRDALAFSGDQSMLTGLHQRLDGLTLALERLSGDLLRSQQLMIDRLERAEATLEAIYKVLAAQLVPIASNHHQASRSWLPAFLKRA